MCVCVCLCNFAAGNSMSSLDAAVLYGGLRQCVHAAVVCVCACMCACVCEFAAGISMLGLDAAGLCVQSVLPGMCCIIP